MNGPLIAAEGIARRYFVRKGLFGQPAEIRAVDGVTLNVERGRTLGLVGESGSGKSTTGRVVLGLEKPDEGKVLFEGAAMAPAGTADWRRQRARMQMVFQDPLGALDRRLPIATQVREPLDVHGIGTREEREARAAALLRDVGLNADLGRRYPHELSGGQRQRAVIARALATKPDFLVCDEPVSALDVSIQAQVVNLLTDLQAELGLAVLFISHDLKVVRQISHRVAVMYLGRIVEEGDADRLFFSPRHPYSQALVSSVPSPGKTGRPRIVLQGEPPNPAARPSGCAFHPRCPVAVVRCRSESPALKALDGERKVACHLVQAEAPALKVAV